MVAAGELMLFLQPVEDTLGRAAASLASAYRRSESRRSHPATDQLGAPMWTAVMLFVVGQMMATSAIHMVAFRI